MRLSIGMASYNNFTEVFFTVQSLRLYHNLSDCEILIVDNFGDKKLETFIKDHGNKYLRYEKYLLNVGTSSVRNQVFELAQGDMVMCIDSHVLIKPGSLDNIPVTDDLIHGPLIYDDLKNYSCSWKPEWRNQMWGVWADCYQLENLPKQPFEIWGMGLGLFMTSKSGWLGFNKNFKGFGGEEGYIHEKYRKAGRKVLCYPSIIWNHLFNKPITYPLHLVDRIRNYLIGFEELGLDHTGIVSHFGEKLIAEAKALI